MGYKFFECLNDLNGEGLERETFIKLDTDDFEELMDLSNLIGIEKGFFNEDLDLNCVNNFQYDSGEGINSCGIDKDEFNTFEYLIPCEDLPDDILELLSQCQDIYEYLDEYLKENNITIDELKTNLKKLFEEINFKEFDSNFTILEYVVDTNYYDLIINGDWIDSDVTEVDKELEEELKSMKKIDYIYDSYSEKRLYKTNKNNYWIWESDRFCNKCLDSVFGTYHKATNEELEEFDI